MKIIQDIRLYRSEQRSENGVLLTNAFASKELNAIIHRIVMKLRESEFSLGEFDHLYVNFTTCDTPQRIMLSENVDRYHPWYRDCSVRIGEELYQRLGTPETYLHIVGMIGEVLTEYFAAEDFDGQKIRSCIAEAWEQGEQMLMVFKMKITAKRKAVIYLRYLDSCRYRPLLRVYDPEEQLLLERDLPQMLTLDALGEIQLSMKKVTIKPRKNAFTEKWKPIVFEY